MEPKRAGKVDVSAIASLAAVVAALAAVTSAGLVAWQVRDEGRRARLNTAVESVWHLSDQWNSSTMLDIRSRAAAGLLAGKPTPDIDDVLSFFQEVGLLVNRGAVDEEFAAMRFYWPMAAYSSASKDYLDTVQRNRPSALDDVGGLVNRLGVAEARRRNRAVTDLLPSKEQVQQFLLDEQGGDQCSDDSEAQKTPASFRLPGICLPRKRRSGCRTHFWVVRYNSAAGFLQASADGAWTGQNQQHTMPI